MRKTTISLLCKGTQITYGFIIIYNIITKPKNLINDTMSRKPSNALCFNVRLSRYGYLKILYAKVGKFLRRDDRILSASRPSCVRFGNPQTFSRDFSAES